MRVVYRNSNKKKRTKEAVSTLLVRLVHSQVAEGQSLKEVLSVEVCTEADLQVSNADDLLKDQASAFYE